MEVLRYHIAAKHDVERGHRGLHPSTGFEAMHVWLKRSTSTKGNGKHKKKQPLRRVAEAWLGVGLFGLAFLVVIAFAIFGLGVPVHRRSNWRDTGEVISRADAAKALEVLMLGFGAFVGVGAILLLVSKRPDS